MNHLIFRVGLVASILFSFSIQSCDQLNLEDCYAPLNGTWIRVESDNPNGDCMRIVISGESAVVLDNPRNFASFDEGTILWQTITHVAQFKEYTLEVKGSDGQFYDATIELDGTNTLNLMIDAAGNGSTQKWVRAEIGEKVSECETISVEGNWTRTSSNNTNNDGMRMRISSTDGVLTFVPTSATSYSVNDVLWKDVLPSGSGDSFTCEVLGSDGQYYSASFQLENRDKLILSIGSSGNGNTQTWER